MKSKRLCIFPQDISILTGRSAKSSRDLFNKLKAYYKKEKHQFVTFKEFAEYSGIPLDELNDS